LFESFDTTLLSLVLRRSAILNFARQFAEFLLAGSDGIFAKASSLIESLIEVALQVLAPLLDSLREAFRFRRDRSFHVRSFQYFAFARSDVRITTQSRQSGDRSISLCCVGSRREGTCGQILKSIQAALVLFLSTRLHLLGNFFQVFIAVRRPDLSQMVGAILKLIENR
jgi:hypothetical protein